MSHVMSPKSGLASKRATARPIVPGSGHESSSNTSTYSPVAAANAVLSASIPMFFGVRKEAHLGKLFG